MLAPQSCPTLCNPIEYSLPASSVHGISQVRIILEWVAIPFSRGSFQPRAQTWVSSITGRFFTIWAIWVSYQLTWRTAAGVRASRGVSWETIPKRRAVCTPPSHVLSVLMSLTNWILMCTDVREDHKKTVLGACMWPVCSVARGSQRRMERIKNKDYRHPKKHACCHSWVFVKILYICLWV